MASTCTSGTVYQSDRSFGSWIVDLWRDRLKGHREDMKRHRPICHGTSCIFLQALCLSNWFHYYLMAKIPQLLFGGETETELGKGLVVGVVVVVAVTPFSWVSIPFPSVIFCWRKKGPALKRNLSQTRPYIMCVCVRESNCECVCKSAREREREREGEEGLDTSTWGVKREQLAAFFLCFWIFNSSQEQWNFEWIVLFLTVASCGVGSSPCFKKSWNHDDCDSKIMVALNPPKEKGRIELKMCWFASLNFLFIFYHNFNLIFWAFSLINSLLSIFLSNQ